MKSILEKEVIVRSNMSGVWHGTLQQIDKGAGEGVDVVLSNASKIHYWEGAAATSGLALHGPGKGSRVCEPVETAVVTGCCEVLLATSAATAQLEGLERWKV